MYKALEQRRAQLSFSEKKIAAVETKVAELAQKSAEIDLKMKALVEREAVVTAVKAEVDSVHQISARSKADLQYVSDHREEVATLRRQVQDAARRWPARPRRRSRPSKHAGRWSRRCRPRRASSRTCSRTCAINLETLGEQKAVIDHVGEKLARLEFMMQEAQNTLHTLQHERELAERIEQSIKQLRTRSTTKPEDTGAKKVTA